MGFLSSLAKGLGEKSAEMAYEYYQRAKREEPRTLKSVIQEQQSILTKAAFLLALGEKDSYSAKEIYTEHKSAYDSAFVKLKYYRRFEPIVDNFMRKFNSSY